MLSEFMPVLIPTQFFFKNMIMPITEAIITTTNIIEPIISAPAKEVNTLPTVLIAVVAIAVISVPVTTVDYESFISCSCVL